ncbi:MAG: agmatine deiminase [Acidobacteria bacterium]|nr:MAG: agmatine deiminase [Acidobacteriota bacterium]
MPSPNSDQIEFRMPAEWERHAATWLAWPHYKLDWPGKFEPIPWVYAEIIRYLSRHERVELIVKDAAAEKLARKTLKRAHALNENVRFHRWATNRVWTRDSGCAFVHTYGAGALSRDPSGAKARIPVALPAWLEAVPFQENSPPEIAGIKWRFNAWAKYPNWKQDENIGSLMAKAAGTEEIRPMFGKNRVVLEGGSIDVNGQGTLITTEECLLSRVQQRNPGMKKRDYEKIFAEYLGMTNIIWLGSGIVGDDTLATIDLPMPAPVYFEGRRLPASYANFYIANDLVLVPVFNDPNDRVALDILADIFPDRDIAPIYCGDLIWGFGAIHCMTQQQPAIET